VKTVERRLRNATAPNEVAAEGRAWEVAREVYGKRTPAPRTPRRARYLVAPVAIALVAALALTPAGAAVHRWIDQTLGVKHARPELFSLPTSGRILVAGSGGVWTIQPDGSKRRLGSGEEATWSPHALYVAVAQQDQLAATSPRGVTVWSVARPDVRFPRWYPPNGYRVAYLSASDLRVVAGDGTGDRLLARGVAAVAPAWRPNHPYEVVYVKTGGVVVARDADSGAIAWSHRIRPTPRLLEWSTDGRRLLVLADDTATVYAGSGRTILRATGPRGLRDGALSPDGRTLALLSPSELTLTGPTGLTRSIFEGPGLGQLAWSPDGRWLLVTWPAANQWVFVRATGRPRISAVSRITQQFNSFPHLEGWCCTASGGSSH
jgi:hypothetical protein